MWRREGNGEIIRYGVVRYEMGGRDEGGGGDNLVRFKVEEGRL